MVVIRGLMHEVIRRPNHSALRLRLVAQNWPKWGPYARLHIASMKTVTATSLEFFNARLPGAGAS